MRSLDKLYADEMEKLSAEFNRSFSELKKYDKIFEIFSSPFQVDVSSVPETLQMEIINLQYFNAFKQVHATTSINAFEIG